MGSLVFVGAGLSGAQSMSLEALEAVKTADHVFLESYTTYIDKSFTAELEALTGIKPLEIGRREVEEGRMLLDAARSGKAILIAGGESMSATTHISLRIDAARQGISTHVIFAPSIFNAAPSMLGLHLYKFGRTVSIPRFGENYRPASPLRLIESNLNAGAHSLVLLDVDAEQHYFMTPGEAFGEILEMCRHIQSDRIGIATLACTVSRAGRRDGVTAAGSIARLLSLDYGSPPHCIVIPARLHFQEAEALSVFSGASEEELRDMVE